RSTGPAKAPSIRDWRLRRTAQGTSLRRRFPQQQDRRVRFELQSVHLAGELFRSRASGRVRAVRYPEHLGNLYVTYAKQDEAAQRDVPGPGLGFVSVFDANGYINWHRPSDSRYVRLPLSSAEPRRQRHDGQGVIQMTWVIDAAQRARAVRGRTRRGAHRR